MCHVSFLCRKTCDCVEIDGYSRCESFKLIHPNYKGTREIITCRPSMDGMRIRKDSILVSSHFENDIRQNELQFIKEPRVGMPTVNPMPDGLHCEDIKHFGAFAKDDSPCPLCELNSALVMKMEVAFGTGKSEVLPRRGFEGVEPFSISAKEEDTSQTFDKDLAGTPSTPWSESDLDEEMFTLDAGPQCNDPGCQLQHEAQRMIIHEHEAEFCPPDCKFIPGNGNDGGEERQDENERLEEPTKCDGEGFLNNRRDPKAAKALLVRETSPLVSCHYYNRPEHKQC